MKRILTLLFLCISGAAHAQVNTDSLWQVALDTSLGDTVRLKAVDPLLFSYYGKNVDTVMMLSKLQLEIAEQSEDLSWTSYALFQRGYAHFEASQFQKSIEYYERSIDVYKERGDQERGIANCKSNIALSLLNLGKYEEAFENYSDSRDLYMEVKDSNMVGRTISQLGMIRDFEGRWLESLDFYFEALNIFEQLKDQYGQSVVLLNIGSIYESLNDKPKMLEYLDKSLTLKKLVKDEYGEAIILSSKANIMSQEGKLDEALANHYQAFNVYKKFNSQDKMGESYKSIAIVYLQKPEFDSALYTINKAINLQRELELLPDLSESLHILGNIYINKNAAQKAIKACTEGRQLANNTGYLNSEKKNCLCLSEAYEKQGKYQNAFQFYKYYDTLQDSLINEEATREATRKEMNFSFAKKSLTDSLHFIQEQEITAIKHEAQLKEEKNQRKILYIGLGIISIFSFFLYNRFWVTRKQKNIISKEKQRSETLLLNILPEETAEELKANGTAKARNYDAVTVMFTDFKSFTKISEQLSPQELVSEIDYCFKAFDNIISKYQIEKIKTIGDAYMCASGLPKTNLKHAKDIVTAAIEIRNFMNAYKLERDAIGKPAFEVRIGIHTGPVVAGVVGTKKFTYDIWGDTVNTAARMESSGQEGKINISNTTCDLIQSEFKTAYRGKVDAKNKGQIEMYFVEDEG